ncbi:MAG: glycosyltransferase family 9 protein [Desulfuromonadaceae bacterium]|nr:glycosyltransferase family 9 protein [Desulfuromonadaceae bacterium]
MNIQLMKLFDAVIGRIVASVFPAPLQITPPCTVTSLLLIRPGGIGDAVLLAPAINSLKKTFPSARVSILAEKRNAGIFCLIPGVDNLLCYDSPGELFQALLGSYDVVIDTEQWHRLSAVVARMVSAPVKIGFCSNERRRMFTHTVPYSHDDYETLSFVRLLKPLGIEGAKMNGGVPFLFVPHAATDTVAGLLEPIQGDRFVTIFPGASIRERRWGAERFRRVAEILAGFGIKTVVVGGKVDRRQGKVIAGNGVGLDLTGVLTLPETAAVIQKSALLLSGDSGVLHIATGLGIPTVSLFGSGRAKKWAPKGDDHLVINKNLPCSPCTTYGSTPSCSTGVQCMRDIDVDDVVNAVTMLLTTVGTMPFRCCNSELIKTGGMSNSTPAV